MGEFATNDEVWRIALSAASAEVRARLASVVQNGPPPFFDFAMTAVEQTSEKLLDSMTITRAIADPALLPLEHAIRLAKAAARIDPILDHTLLVYLTSASRNWPVEVPEEESLRVLGVIDAISDCRRLVIPLVKFLKLPSRRLRSKAVKLMARAVRNPRWADTILDDVEPRVRANLVEGLATQLGKRSEWLLRRAASDPHHRVSATALLALTRLGDPDSHHLIEQMAAQGDAEHRRAAQWALAQLGESSPSTTTLRQTA